MTILNVRDVMSGLALACVVPNKGHPVYAEGELRRFILETGRTFGVLQADPEASLVALAETVTSELGGLSLRKVPLNGNKRRERLTRASNFSTHR